MITIYKKKIRFKTAQIIAMGFAAIILLGALLLSLPVAWAPGHQITFIDALFTATSATCVTGLVVNNTATFWSSFVHVVLLLLIQIGGMGVVTIAVAIALISGKRIIVHRFLRS